MTSDNPTSWKRSTLENGDAQCPACPVEVRSLFAAAHNAHGAINRAFQGTGDWDRARRKLADLGRELERFQVIVDAHFSDRDHYHPQEGVN